jgi:antitoxin (DNA-binding transcriptional repressor) of toxin-antitoxin stability system
MKIASISQTKNQLSALLDLVKQGETVLIMDRDRPVARLEPVTPASGEETEARLLELEREGIIRRARRRAPSKLLLSPPPKAKGGASALEALLADREEGR